MKSLITGTIVLLMGIWLVTAVSATPDSSNWSFPDRAYRMPITVQANGFARSDKVVELDVDFGARLTALGEAGSFDENSVRVVEVDANGNALDTAVSFQFDNGSTLNEPSGTLVWLLTGSTAANASRYYQVYFDAGGTFSAPSFTDRVDRKSDQNDEGQSSYRVETKDVDGTVNTTYFYHKEGAGFSSVVDRNGDDWVGYQSGSGTKSGGEYRGIPNLGDVFHPGYDGNASSTNQGSNSTVLNDGPLKLTYRSISKDGNYTAVWAIYPTFAEMTVTIGDGSKYWMLYEGTPGGVLNYTGANKDYMVTADNSVIDVNGTYDGDFDQDWVYFADGTDDRSIFIAHGPDDAIIDSYRHQDDFANGSQADAMTVFGFGRKLNGGVNFYLESAEATYTFGLAESRDHTTMTGIVNNAIKDVVITVGNEAPVVDTNDGVAVDEGETAVFSTTNLATSDPEGGKVTFEIVTPPANGTLYRDTTPLGATDTFTQADIAAGLVSYEHDGSETISDSIVLNASDDVQTIANFTVTITVTPVNTAPTGTTDNIVVLSGIPKRVNLVTNDNDVDSTGLVITALTTPTHGQVVNNGDGTVTYTADSTYEGADSFTYRASDGELTSGVTTVNVTVQPSQKVFLPLLIK
jgi:hypothetical protein